jgi:ACS family tartrate transporter-like MFS transporter
MPNDSNDVAQRARRRIAMRLLPFVFLLYVICYIDRANVSFANLRMSADLGFSDRVYGLGVGMFFVGYIFLEIPGAIIVERWSARKWLARIMITWGIATVFTAFVQTATQFYVARFFVGIAEASFFPGVIVYLTHWFRQADRAKAIASFYAAVPSSSVIGSLLATWLLRVQWRGLSGWRWIFIVEGIGPIILGGVTIFFLTDRPEEARWLPEDERDWIVAQLKSEMLAKKRARDYSIFEAFRERRVLLLVAAYSIGLTGMLANTYWLPTFLKRLSGLPNTRVAFLAAIPGLLGIAAMLLNGWHSDRHRERRLHTAVPLFCGAVAYFLLSAGTRSFSLTLLMFVLGGGLAYAFLPTLWSIPTMILTESAAAACFGLINTIGQTGGIVGPYVVGRLNEKTGSVLAALGFIGACYLMSGCILLAMRMKDPTMEQSTLLRSAEATGDL